MKKPLLVFDLDGTLIDSAGDIAFALNSTLQKYGKPAVDHATIVAHIGEGLRKLLEDFFPELASTPEEQNRIEKEFFAAYEREMLVRTRVFPGVMKFLKSYDGPVAIITNKREAPAKALVQHLELNQIPWIDIFGADTLSEKKPSPLPLFTMMKKAGYEPSNTIMIGDGTPDMQSAQRAGVRSIAIGFGYTDVKILQSLGGQKVLNHYDEMESLLAEWPWSSLGTEKESR